MIGDSMLSDETFQRANRSLATARTYLDKVEAQRKAGEITSESAQIISGAVDIAVSLEQAKVFDQSGNIDYARLALAKGKTAIKRLYGFYDKARRSFAVRLGGSR